LPDPPSADDLLSSLASLLTAGKHVEGMTREEIGQAKGWSREITLQALTRAKRAGKLVAGRAFREAIDGVMRQVPVYSIRGE
jgi:hypothetical protein